VSIDHVIEGIVERYQMDVDEEEIQRCADLLRENWIFTPGCLWRVPVEVAEEAVKNSHLPALLAAELVHLAHMYTEVKATEKVVETTQRIEQTTSSAEPFLPRPPLRVFTLGYSIQREGND